MWRQDNQIKTPLQDLTLNPHFKAHSNTYNNVKRFQPSEATFRFKPYTTTTTTEQKSSRSHSNLITIQTTETKIQDQNIVQTCATTTTTTSSTSTTISTSTECTVVSEKEVQDLKLPVVKLESNTETEAKADFNKAEKQETEDDDIIEICEVKPSSVAKQPFYKPSNNPYRYTKSLETAEIMNRWKVKRLTNKNRDFSVSNYKKRLNKDKSIEIPAKNELTFKEGIFVQDCENAEMQMQNDRVEFNKEILSVEDQRKIDLDQKSLANRIRIINQTKEQMKRQFRYIHDCHLEELRNRMPPINSFNYQMADHFLQDTIAKLGGNLEEKLNGLEMSAQSEIKAISHLFSTKSYVLGKLSEYRKVETYQPSAKRSNYMDSGHRILFLPMNSIKNVLIEDEIYYHFYGFPVYQPTKYSTYNSYPVNSS